MSIQSELVGALSALVPGVPSGEPARIHPVLFPESYRFEDGASIIYMVDDSAVDGEGVSMCDALGLIAHKVLVGIVSTKYAECWTLRNQALPLIAALPGVSINVAGRDGAYNEAYRTFLVEIEFVARRQLA